MKTGLRYAVFMLFVVAVLVLAQSGTAWANPRAETAPVGASSGSSAPEAAADGKGTVKPPPGHITITQPGTYSVGGCLVRVESLAPGITLTVQFIPRYQYGRKMDDDHPKFRTGTCRIIYYQNGKQIDGIQDPEQGVVSACFAAPQTPQGIVHEYGLRDHNWHHQRTTYEVYDPATGTWRPANPGEPALTCGQANLSGYYLVASN